MTGFDVERFRQECRESNARLGSPLSYQPITGSTNDDALLAARSGAPSGAVFVADEQTAGRGRRGNRWFAAPAESLLFSVVLRPELDVSALSALTLAIGLGLRDAVAPLVSITPQIKWPNDLYADSKKLAGVLVESSLRGERSSAVVVGVGLNVTGRDFPPEIAARATSLALLSSTELHREPLLCRILNAIDARVTRFEVSGVSGILDELNVADALRGKELRVDGERGIGRGLDAQGRLRLETADGRTVPILSGTVEFL